MKTIYVLGLLLFLGATPAFSQTREPGTRPGFPFRYYKPGWGDSLQFPALPGHPGLPALPDLRHRDLKFRPRQPGFFGALPGRGEMPVHRPLVRDKMPVARPDSSVKYHLRIKAIPDKRTPQ
jgi:hypothetical protein